MERFARIRASAALDGGGGITPVRIIRASTILSAGRHDVP
jgi:hypothetical protein